MPSPLEYLLLMTLSAQPNALAADMLANIEPASGNAKDTESFVIQDNGHVTMRTILMEPQNMMSEHFEAPMKIPPEWVPSFTIGTPLNVKIDATGKTYAAKVVRIESITDEHGSTIQVISALKKRPEELQPGMVGTATVTAIR